VGEEEEEEVVGVGSVGVVLLVEEEDEDEEDEEAADISKISKEILLNLGKNSPTKWSPKTFLQKTMNLRSGVSRVSHWTIRSFGSPTVPTSVPSLVCPETGHSFFGSASLLLSASSGVALTSFFFSL